MKRPEGFDPPTAGSDDAAGKSRAPRRPRPTPAAPATPTPPTPTPPTPTPPTPRQRPPQAPVAGASAAPAREPATGSPATGGRPTSPGAPRRPVLPGSAVPPAEPQKPSRADSRRPRREQRAARVVAPAVVSERDARRELARAARQRRRFEKGEVKRFTRRSRTRRTIWLSVAGVVVVLTVVLAIAVYSPLLALRTVTVDGASRVDPVAVSKAVDSQLGTPIALLDYDTITGQLARFPLIRSYVTEVVPPDTLLIHIVERAPVGAVVNGAEFDLVDPAGIVVQSGPTRPEGAPLIDIGDQDSDSSAFRSVVEVLLALPAPLLAQVDTISATTKDDVSFLLRGVGQTVVWGSSERSEFKASTLAAMVANQDQDRLLEYDVSAPGSVVVTPK